MSMEAVNKSQSYALLAAAVIRQGFNDIKNWSPHIRDEAKYFFSTDWFEVYAAIAGADPEFIKEKAAL